MKYINMSETNMNFSDLIDYESRDYKANAIYPPKKWFEQERRDKWDWRSIKSSINNSSNRVVITHNDADGLVSGAIFKKLYPNVSVVPVKYNFVEKAFNCLESSVKENDIEEVIVSDLNLDNMIPSIEGISNEVESFKWFDHHEWGSRKKKLEEMGVDVTINRNKCAARIVFEYAQSQGYKPSEDARYIVDLTEDHDLWIKESKELQIGGDKKLMSDIISTVAYFSDDDDFMDNILDYGEDFINKRNDLFYIEEENFLEDKIREDIKTRNYIINNYTKIEEIGGYDVALCYGRASPGNLLESVNKKKGSINILVLIRPKGKVSVRSDESFKYCHKITEKMGGGGHEQSAGAFPDFVENWSLGDYITHWNQRGHTGLVKNIKNKVRRTINNKT